MTRIISGTARGRRLLVPPAGTRPTSDRVREAVFSTLSSQRGFAGLTVLDCYAGSGALVLEALSRGAAAGVAVERDRRAVGVIRRNAGTVGVSDRLSVWVGEVGGVLSGTVSQRFDLALLDPPYDLAGAELSAVLGQVARWLSTDATVVVERSS